MEKIISLQSLRAVAFIGVFLTHVHSPICWGAWGVSVFFVMSGFLMMHIHYEADKEISIGEAIFFAIRKMKKIYKLHIITMLFAVFLSISVILNQGPTVKAIIELIAQIFFNVTLLQTWVPYPSIYTSLNGVAWYLSAAMFLYFAFPYICGWIKKRTHLAYIIVLILLAQIFFCRIWLSFVEDTNTAYLWFMFYFPIIRLGDFFIGCCIGKAYHNRKLKKISSIKGTVMEFAALAVTVFIVHSIPYKGTLLMTAIHNWTTLFTVSASVWVYLFVCSDGLFTKATTNSVFIFIGNISAYTYLIHLIVILYVNNLLGYLNISLTGKTYIVTILLEFVLTIIISLLYLRITKKHKQ